MYLLRLQKDLSDSNDPSSYHIPNGGIMTHSEQKAMIRELRDYEGRMTRDEQENFRMYVKRDKDDEDLDELSKKNLMVLYEKYVVNRPRKAVTSPFGDRYKQ
jgi:hypothetical protein